VAQRDNFRKNENKSKNKNKSEGLTIQRNSVELLVGESGVTDALEVDEGSAGGLAILVVHEGALLEGADAGLEDKL